MTCSRRRFFRFFSVSFFVLFLSAYLNVYRLAAQNNTAQNSADANSNLQTLQDQIKSDQERLLETEQLELENNRSVTNINGQIASSEARAATYRNRLGTMTTERDSLFSSIDALESRVSRLKSEYTSRATYAYKHGRLHDIALILSASSINQMLIRIQYLHRFSTQRTSQLLEIRDASSELKTKREALQRSLIQNEVILKNAEREASGLTELKSNRQQEARRLEAEQQLIAASLNENRSEMDELVMLVTASGSTAGSELAENIQQTTHFEAIRGALPWPVRGKVLEPFGEVVNAELGTSTDNVGIVIETEASAEIKATFGGRVRLVDVMPGLGRVMFLEHGDYLTVYGNFSLLYAGQGDMIKAGDTLGRSGTDAEPRGRSAFFGVFYKGEPVDPRGWLGQ
jgi:murein hydrolase activator